MSPQLQKRIAVGNAPTAIRFISSVHLADDLPLEASIINRPNATIETKVQMELHNKSSNASSLPLDALL